MKKEIEKFECSKEVKKQLADPIKELKKICTENKLPFFIGIVLAETGDNTEYFSEILSPTVADVNLSQDNITKMINVMSGFDVVCKKNIEEIDVHLLR